jgi:hypothetical protein
MKNRIELAKHFASLGFKKGAEIGVAYGYYSEVLFKNIPGLELYSVDAWISYARYRDYRDQSTYDKMIKTATEILTKYNCHIVRKSSMDAVRDFSDGSLDFVYIDANHKYEFVKDDIREWSKKVRKGGIVSGHDYYLTKSGNTGVIRAVDEYVKKHGLTLEITGWDRRNLIRDDRQPSWWFIKK